MTKGQTTQNSAGGLGVVVLDQLGLRGTLAELLRVARLRRRQEPQLALQIQQLLVRVGFDLEAL